MIADKRLNIYQEVYSVQYARSIVQSVWAQAAALEVKEFIPKIRHEIRDDHLALNQLARIPTIDLIDFDYDPWHTTQDIPANCSGAMAPSEWWVWQWNLSWLGQLLGLTPLSTAARGWAQFIPRLHRPVPPPTARPSAAASGHRTGSRRP